MPAKRFPAITTILLHSLFFLSGATTLIYEISWTRQLGLLLGQTVLAGSVVLASLFLGLAVGYAVGGRLAFSEKTLRLFGLCEIVAAAWAVCVPQLLQWLQSPAVVQWMTSEQVARQWASRSLIGIGLLLPATVALGATLPLMAESLARVARYPTRSAAVGYAWNTAGAMFGTLICTYVLLLHVGVAGSSLLAAFIAASAGVVAIACSLWLDRGATKTRSSVIDSASGLSKSVRLLPLLVIAALSGFVTLALQILYTRLFSLVFHNSTYTFGNVIAAFLLALAIGAALVAVGLRRWQADAIMFGCGIAAAVSCVLLLAVFVYMTKLEYFIANGTFVGHLVRGFGLVCLFVMVPVTLSGMIFPATWQLLDRDHPAGQLIGWLAMVNAIGAAFGSLFASFVALPTVGLWGGFLIISLLLVLIAVLAGVVSEGLALRRRRVIAFGTAVCLIGSVGLLMPSWSRMGRAHDEVLVSRRESAYGWIDITRSREEDAWYIYQNLHYRLGGTGKSAMRERRQAHLPMLLHPKPERVLFLGMGTGVTAAGAIQHPETEMIEIVELVPDVTAAARQLGHRNDHVLADDRVHVTTDDARHFLLRTHKRYDVIVSDLFVPWESQTGYLYTREHYESAARRLAEDGLFCQWLPVYQLGAREFTVVADTFATVFPETTLWWGKIDPIRPTIGLVGSHQPFTIATARLRLRLANLNQSHGREDPQLDSVEDLRLAAIGSWRVKNPNRLNLDEIPRVEFWTPESLMQGQLLRGAWFAQFYDEVLAQLPPPSIMGGSGKFLGGRETVEQTRQVQRFLLFGEG